MNSPFKKLIFYLSVLMLIVSCNLNTNNNNKINESNESNKNYNQEIINSLIDSTNSKSVIKLKLSEKLDSKKLIFLKKLNGKYPHMISLFDHVDLKKRLIRLIGKERFNFLITNCSVEMPIIVDNNEFIAEGCKAHSCPETGYFILFDFTLNCMQVCIKEDFKYLIYIEEGSVSQKILDWQNHN